MNRLLTLVLACLFSACSGGGAGSPCAGSCADAPQRLEVAEVERVLAQAIAEAQARGVKASIAVVDRSGNVLGVFRMTGARQSITIDSGRGVRGGLEGISLIPDSLAAIAKAITAAYLSTEGNAFSTRSVSLIIQQHFYPGEFDQPGGPLFGVQFSSLPCSDLSTRFNGTRPAVGPQRSPLGLSADPGGFPLYKNGTVVGGVGVMADGVYGLDLDAGDSDSDLDELIALAASSGFEPPQDRRAERITLDGKPLRYSDATPALLATNPASAPAFATLDGVAGSRISVPGYSSNALVAGTAFGQSDSGIRAATGVFAALDGFVLVDSANAERFAPRAATDAAVTGASALSAAEVQQLLASALAVANRARAQIRRPLGTPARVSIAVTDTYGAALGLVRSRDAPLFGLDVSLQKARSAALFSNRAAAADLLAAPETQYLANGQNASIAAYVQRFRDFLGQPNALADGAYAYGGRSIGNLARPYFPDGIRAPDNFGPLAKRISDWSVFSIGLQLDLVNSALIQHVTFVLGGGSDTAPGSCTPLPLTPNGQNRLANGLQIFAGAVPVYRAAVLVGGIGISGDGIDQDDMIAFLGLHEAGLALNGALNHAPASMRADQLVPQGARLRYVQCPQAPYHASSEQNVCEGK